MPGCAKQRGEHEAAFGSSCAAMPAGCELLIKSPTSALDAARTRPTCKTIQRAFPFGASNVSDAQRLSHSAPELAGASTISTDLISQAPGRGSAKEKAPS